MKKLEEYPVLVEQTFYRGWHILAYIKEHPNISSLEKEAIAATIMDALVSTGSILEEEALDFEHGCITLKQEGLYTYQKYPNVCGYPFWMKQKFRERWVVISGSIPISISLAMPTGVSRCVYDMNTSVSAVFDDFTFYVANYNSPTREGVIAKDRPFIEVSIDGIAYLVDTLTKRIFRRDYFEATYGLEIVKSLTKAEIMADPEKRKIYEKQTTPSLSLAPYLSLALLIQQEGVLKNGYEHAYEIEQSKIYCKEGWEQYQKYDDEMRLFYESHQFVKGK